LAEKDNSEKPENDQNQAENQHLLLLQEGNKRKLALSNKASFETEQSIKADGSKHVSVHLKTEKSNRSQGKKQIQEKVAHAKTVNTEETDVNDLGFLEQERDASILVRKEEDAENPNYRVFTYNLTRNYKPQIGIKDAIKKYEDATINNPYDNSAFLNLAHAYYSKAMYLDDAIARREDAPEGNQSFSVKRFYLSETGVTGSTDTFDNAIAFRNRPSKIYEEMFREAIVEYKSALRTSPNSSSSLYGLAFSFSVKGSHLEIASRGKKKYKKTSFQ